MNNARQFWESIHAYKQDHDNWNMNDMLILIRARDKDIVEACKKAVDEEVNLSREGYKSMVRACDSVLRDLG